MSREDALFLLDMKTACQKIQRFVAGLDRTQFFFDEKTHDAVLRNLQIIGEAVKHVSPELKEKNPAIEWRKIAGFRDMVVHEYFGIDENILWDVICTRIPLLNEQLKGVNVS